MKIVKLILIFLCVAFILSAQTGLYKNSRKQFIERNMNFSDVIGKKLGDFKAESINNGILSNKNLKGKITLITFWFAACKPCREEFNNLRAIHKKYQEDNNFQLFAFTFDNVESVKKTMSTDSLAYTIIPVSKNLCSKLNFGKGYPVNLITGSSGEIIYAGGWADIYKSEKYFQNIIIPKLDSALYKLPTFK
jgi:hypothetical protein